ncbi:hypothetical protein BN946_scf185015.g146 [Trametes cinnabarina]|uniref:VWFA domain-containing protein n=1 Tax=Pycnoporus cinnabarinus TaxID=5643 RepID=A0A060SH66_PYCCI|nr:hypothetical protein BN946_scf185015.g146 [Trametes cinnabarina]
MGSSSSKAPSAAYGSGGISYPGPLDKKSGAWVRRRATTAVHPSGSGSSLGVPAHSHRRSRSALAGNVRPPSDLQPPPPPYAEAVASPTLLAVPEQSQDSIQRSRSQELPRSNNPFVQRPVSTIGPSAGSQGGSATATVTGRATNQAAMTHEERVQYLRQPMRQNTFEDALTTLRKYNTVIIVDDSGSMRGALWNEANLPVVQARDALATLADVAAKYDADGIDLCFLNSNKRGMNLKTAEQVQRIFNSVEPRGATPIGEKLEELLLYYVNSLDTAYAAGGLTAVKAIKPVNYIVITDGAPTDDPASVISTIAKRLDDKNYPLSQVGIQFVQIGNNRAATEYLRTLDDELQNEYKCRDIVDTTPYLGGRLSADTIIKILLGGINRRVDKKGGESVRS